MSESTERAVTRLTEDHTEVTEAGVTEWPPLLLWLERSVTDMVKRGGAGSNGSGIPIDFEALRILDGIRRHTRLIRAGVHLPVKGYALISDVAEAWDAAKDGHEKGWVDDAAWLRICDELESWVHQIEVEQAVRPRKMELTVACPRCERRWFREDVDPKRPELAERKAAVVIEFGEGRAPVAECRFEDCAAMWAGWGQVATLGLSVQASMDVAVLEACGIKLGQGE